MAWVIEWLVAFGQAGLIAALNVRLIETVGGGLVFVGVIVLAGYFGRIHKVFPADLGRLGLGALCLECLNAVAFLEHSGALRRPKVLVAYFLIAVVFSVLTFQVSISPVRARSGAPTDRDAGKIQALKNIAAMYLHAPMLGLMLFGLISGLAVWIGEESWLVQRNWLTISSLALSWQVIGALVQMLFLRKISDEQVAHVVNVRQGFRPVALGRMFVGGLFVMFLLGSIAELGRGLWLFWICSYALWTLTLANSWKVWKHVFGGSEFPLLTGDMPSTYNVVEDFRIFLYSVLAASLYGIGLGVLLGLTSPRIYR